MLRKKLIGLLVCVQIIKLSQEETCIRNQTLEPGVTYYIYNDGYPNRTTRSSCIFYPTVEDDNHVSVNCSIDTVKFVDKCATDRFYISKTGDLSLQDADVYCGKGVINQTSTFRSLAVAFQTSGNDTSGVGSRFVCSVKATPSTCDCGWGHSERIINGEDAHQGEYPSVVGIYATDLRDIFCGGTIISHRLVLSVEHCFPFSRKSEDIIILTGLIDTKQTTKYVGIYYVQRIIFYPKDNKQKHDIALLKTTRDIEFSIAVGPACLPFFKRGDTFLNTNVTYLGWGLDEHHNRPSVLQKVQVQVISTSKCRIYYPDITSKHLCTYTKGKDACQFDSGGPALHVTDRQVLVGLISFGTLCADNNPGVNTRVTSYLDWIISHSDGDLCYKKFI